MYVHLWASRGQVGGALNVDLSAIEANWKQLRSLSSPTDCAAVVGRRLWLA
jgi:hypothetical protein